MTIDELFLFHDFLIWWILNIISQLLTNTKVLQLIKLYVYCMK